MSPPTSGIFMSQKKYAQDVLKRFNMSECKSASTPVECGVILTKEDTGKAVDPTLFNQMVGSLRYLCSNRPEISYGVGLISKFMENPQESHFVAAKRILRYLIGTLGHGVLFPNIRYIVRSEVVGYVDSDWCGYKDDKKSTIGYVFFCGDAHVSWCSKKQPIVALSSCQAEYVAASYSACQVVRLGMLMEEIGLRRNGSMKLQIDNKSVIDLSKHPVAHGKSKPI
ncbi:secreted RxLR effector protein 161-like [Lotus japonicus]|uniref:secreted RxLR effector protein 161-like n=1 Tax=Lotus japonicus TaxID=34305 RepID=UPI002590717A|nr:secreted RxLR effector protein 161-like [Lotus japonicus]